MPDVRQNRASLLYFEARPIQRTSCAREVEKGRIMSMRSQGDIVSAFNNYNDLMYNIYKIVLICKKTKLIDIHKFTYIKIIKLSEETTTVGLYAVESEDHYVNEAVVDSNAGPPGFGMGWEPDGEDIIGYKPVYSGSSHYMAQVYQLKIPNTDLIINDETDLTSIENRYQKAVDEKNRLLKKEINIKEIAETENKLKSLKLKLQK